MSSAVLLNKPPFARLMLSVCLLAACQEAFAAGDVRLKTDAALKPVHDKGQPLQGPTFFEADSIQGEADRHVEASGRAILQNARERLEADWLYLDRQADEVQARGQVRFMQDKDRLEAKTLKLKLEARLGAMEGVRYELHSPPKEEDGAPQVVRGESSKLRFEGEGRYVLEEATYTTCPLDDPDWVFKTRELSLDYGTSLGTARQVRVEYMDVPILYTPWMDFSLDNKRKSGFLAPSYGASTERGLELVVPWYWNIAPNRDATFMPRMMSKRGLQLAGEFRYLESAYRGELGIEYLANDRIANRTRYLGVVRHQHKIGEHWGAALSVEGVSDDDYFVDLSNQISQTSRVNLPRQFELTYDLGWLKARGFVQSFQTLQDPAAPPFLNPIGGFPS